MSLSSSASSTWHFQWLPITHRANSKLLTCPLGNVLPVYISTLTALSMYILGRFTVPYPQFWNLKSNIKTQSFIFLNHLGGNQTGTERRLFRSFNDPTYVEYASVTIEIVDNQIGMLPWRVPGVTEDGAHISCTLPKTQSIVNCQNASVPKVPAKGRPEQNTESWSSEMSWTFQDEPLLTLLLSLPNLSSGGVNRASYLKHPLTHSPFHGDLNVASLGPFQKDRLTLCLLWHPLHWLSAWHIMESSCS